MALIECTAGEPVSTEVAGVTYHFEIDRFGRFVARVENPRHIVCFTSIAEHYREVPEEPIEPGEDAPDGNEDDFQGEPHAPPEGPALGLPEAGEGEEEGIVPTSPPLVPVTAIAGIGPATATKLESVGITTADQLAGLTDEQVASLDDELSLGGKLAGWVSAAKEL